MPELKLSYEDLLSGDAIPMEGVGHLRSPKLKELMPTSGIGMTQYNLYIYFLKAGKEQLNEIFGTGIEHDDDVFAAVTGNATIRGIYLAAFSFFLTETVGYSEKHKVFAVFDGDSAGAEARVVGIIDAAGFDRVRSAILHLNYITPEHSNVATRHSSPEAEAAWSRAQKYLSQLESRKTDSSYSLGNMLSKLCAIHPSINYLNVYELTVFQFYDSFFQTAYMRSVGFSEAVVASNGSKKFRYSDWMKPLKQN